jgi:transmembrane sensor
LQARTDKYTKDGRHRDEARGWLIKLSSGAVDDHDLTRFHAWLDDCSENRAAFETERRFWQKLEFLRAETPPASNGKLKVGRRALLTGAIAAAAAGIVGYPQFATWFEADFRTGAGEQKRVQFPDGSTALLNTDTAMAIDFTANDRLVRLIQGEAQFSVRSENARRFKVASLEGVSETGQSVFTVGAIDGLTTVTTQLGEVRVTAPVADPRAYDASGHQVIVSQSEQTTYRQNQLPSKPAHVDLDMLLAWQQGRLVFEGKPFDRAVREVSRYISERVIMASAARDNTPISAAFSTSEPIAALQALAAARGLSFHRIPGVVIVLS